MWQYYQSKVVGSTTITQRGMGSSFPGQYWCRYSCESKSNGYMNQFVFYHFIPGIFLRGQNILFTFGRFVWIEYQVKAFRRYNCSRKYTLWRFIGIRMLLNLNSPCADCLFLLLFPIAELAKLYSQINPASRPQVILSFMLAPSGHILMQGELSWKEYEIPSMCLYGVPSKYSRFASASDALLKVALCMLVRPSQMPPPVPVQLTLEYTFILQEAPHFLLESPGQSMLQSEPGAKKLWAGSSFPQKHSVPLCTPENR